MSTDDDKTGDNGKTEQDIQELKGHVEETVGKVYGDDELLAHGRADQAAAHAKRAASQVGEAARQLGQRVKERAMDKLGELHERLHEAADDKAEDEADDKAEDKKKPDA